MTPTYVYIGNLALVMILVLANAFFVVSEFSIVKIRRTKLVELAQNGNKRAKIGLIITEHLDTYLSAIQLGITLASLGLGWIGEPAVSRLLELVLGNYFADNPVLLHSVSFGIAFGFITLMHVVLGELIPKSLAIQKTETFVLLIAYPLYMFNRIFFPFIWVFDKLAAWCLRQMGVKPASEKDLAHSEEEIRLIVNASQRGGIIDHTECQIIRNAIDFSDITAHEIMVPRQDIKCLYLNDSYKEAEKVVKNTIHTRYPLCDTDKDNIVGMVHLRDFLLHDSKIPEKELLTKISREILFVAQNKSISEILQQMMRKHIHMAIVVDEYGGTAGLISMEDILEELVGEIMDEHDGYHEEPLEKIDDTTFAFDGVVLVEDALDFMGLPPHAHDESTIGGYIFGLLDKEPKVGDRTEDETCEFEVTSTKRMRITRVKVKLKQPSEETTEE